MAMAIAGTSCTGKSDIVLHEKILTACKFRPVDKDLTVSLLQRAKKNGFTALVITLDTMLLGWRPHDLQTSYLPFLDGVGSQVGLSDPVFAKANGVEPVLDVPEWPYDQKKTHVLLEAGDEKTTQTRNLSMQWILQTNSGIFKKWEDLKHVRDNWDGPLILKGILSVKVCKPPGMT